MTPTPAPQPPLDSFSRRPKWLAILAIVIAAAVPIAMAFGVDVCAPLDAVGIELDACSSTPAPSDAPSPEASDDAGAQ